MFFSKNKIDNAIFTYTLYENLYIGISIFGYDTIHEMGSTGALVKIPFCLEKFFPNRWGGG